MTKCSLCSGSLHILTQLTPTGIVPTGYLECCKCLSLFNASNNDLVANNHNTPKQKENHAYKDWSYEERKLDNE